MDINQWKENYIWEMSRQDRVAEISEGKYVVMGIDKSWGSDWVKGSYNTPDEAIRVAEENSNSAIRTLSDIVYHAYSPRGDYLGGDPEYYHLINPGIWDRR